MHRSAGMRKTPCLNKHLAETDPFTQDNPYSLAKSCALLFAWCGLEEFMGMCQKFSSFDPYFLCTLLLKSHINLTPCC